MQYNGKMSDKLFYFCNVDFGNFHLFLLFEPKEGPGNVRGHGCVHTLVCVGTMMIFRGSVFVVEKNGNDYLRGKNIIREYQKKKPGIDLMQMMLV